MQAQKRYIQAEPVNLLEPVLFSSESREILHRMR